MSQMLHHWRCFHLYHHLWSGWSSQWLQPMYHVCLIQHLRLWRRYHNDLCLHCDHLLHPKNNLNSLSSRASAFTPSWRPRKNIFITPSININTTNISISNNSWTFKNNRWTWSKPFYKTNLLPQQHQPLLRYQPHQQPRNFKPYWRQLAKKNRPPPSQSQCLHLIAEKIGALSLKANWKCVSGTESSMTTSPAPSRRH